MNVGENTTMPYPQCGASIKTDARGNIDAPSITKYGSPVRLNAQMVALRPPCARTALKVPPKANKICIHQYAQNRAGRVK